MTEAVKPGLPGVAPASAASPRDDAEVREFGGALGSVLIITLSHLLMFYLWIAWRFHDGALFYPTSLSDLGPFLVRQWELIVAHATPSWQVFGAYLLFLLFEGVLAAYLPGLRIKGLPIPSRGGLRLEYRCNGISAWYLTLALAAILHFSGVFPLQTIYDRFGEFMVASVVTANVVALVVYFGAKATGNAERMSGSFVYDFFMGHSTSRCGPRFESLG
jgi:delta24(24(1))-sterol reductase